MTQASVIVAAPRNAYPQAPKQAQPWKKWVKLVSVTEEGKELVIMRGPHDNDVGVLGGY